MNLASFYEEVEHFCFPARALPIMSLILCTWYTNKFLGWNTNWHSGTNLLIMILSRSIFQMTETYFNLITEIISWQLFQYLSCDEIYAFSNFRVHIVFYLSAPSCGVTRFDFNEFSFWVPPCISSYDRFNFSTPARMSERISNFHSLILIHAPASFLIACFLNLRKLLFF